MQNMPVQRPGLKQNKEIYPKYKHQQVKSLLLNKQTMLCRTQHNLRGLITLVHVLISQYIISEVVNKMV